MKTILVLFLAVFVAVAAFGAPVSADTLMTMPVLYNASGQPVNTTLGVSLSAGTYYLDQNGQIPVTYYGDGTYLEVRSSSFRGSVYNPTGLAGTFSVPTPAVATSVYTSDSVGIPNTGSGGNAAATWTILGLAAIATAIGGIVLARSRFDSYAV